MNKETMNKKVSTLTIGQSIEAIMIEVKKKLAKGKTVYINPEKCMIRLSPRAKTRLQ